MTPRSTTSSRRARCGLTLVEALLGTAILAALLVAILIGASRLHARMAAGENRMTACRIADGLLEKWWALKVEEFPRQSSDRVDGYPGWSWRTQVVANDAAKALMGEVVALEILPPGRTEGPGLVRVEVLLPEKKEAASEAGVHAH